MSERKKEAIMADTGKRLQFADMVKGIAVLGVVAYHLLAPCGFKNFILTVTDCFLITFFFYSGYFYTPGKRTIRESLSVRFRTLMVPFVKWSLFFWLAGSAYLLLTNEATLFETVCCLRNYFAGMIWNRQIQNLFSWNYYRLGSRYTFLAGMWFLPAMMFANVLFIPIAEQTLKRKYAAVASVPVLLVLTMVLYYFKVNLPYNIQMTPFWASAMLAGTGFRQFHVFETEGVPRARLWLRAICASAAAIGVCVFLKKPAYNMFRGVFPEPQVWYIPLTAVCGLVCNYGISLLCRLAEESGMRVKELAWCGSHSLTIYLLHEFFAWVIFVLTGFTVIRMTSADAAAILKSILVSAVSLALCVAAQTAMDRIREAKEKRAAKN